MSKFFRVNWVDVKEALAMGIIMALVVVILEVIAAKSIFGLDWKTLANTGVMAFLTVFVSFLKSLLTTSSGTLAGVKIK